MTEPKEERFRRVAEARVNKIIKMIRLLGNCSRTGSYAYTAAQAAKIFDALQNELNHARERFLSAGSRERRRFSLSDTVPKTKPDGPRLYLSLPDGFPVPDSLSRHGPGVDSGASIPDIPGSCKRKFKNRAQNACGIQRFP